MSLFVTLHMFFISACCIACCSMPHNMILKSLAVKPFNFSLRVMTSLFQNLLSNELPSGICRTLNVPRIGVVPSIVPSF